MASIPSFLPFLERKFEPVNTWSKCILALFLALASISFCRVETLAGDESQGVQGLLMPSSQARLASRSKGVIEMIRREGEKVKSGETVMQLESDLESLQTEQQEHVLALRTFEREASDELSQKSVISKTEVEEKRVNHEVAKVQLTMAKRMLEMRNVIAPFDGVISERLREKGEAVDEFTPVVVLVNLENLYLEVYLPASLIRTVRVGDQLEVVSEHVPGKTFPGSVAEVAPAVNPASGEFKAKILVPNADGELAAGTSARAIFHAGED